MRSRDGAVVAGVATWILAVLVLDTAATVGQQRLLGAGTWAVLLLVLRGEDRSTRVQVGVVVVFATGVELVFAGVLGVYVYREAGDEVPAFVPPGHGLVYLAALCVGRSGWAHAHARGLLRVTLVVAAAWAVWGLVLSPRPDALGAFWFGCLLVFAWRGRSPLLYAGAFLVVSALELVGTSLGTWTWQPVDPTGLISIGNPPSGIAGGYAWFDAAALWATPRVLRRWERRRAPATATAARPGRSPARSPAARRTAATPPARSGPAGPSVGCG